MRECQLSSPDIRISGSVEDWTRIPLCQAVSRVRRKNDHLETKRPLTISAELGLIDQAEYFNKRIAADDIRNYYLIRKGEFAYNKSSSDGYPYGSIKRLEAYENGALSTLYIVFALCNDFVDANYLSCFFDTDHWHRDIMMRASEGARNHGLLNISAESFLETMLSLPKDHREQQQIGLMFKKLDYRIKAAISKVVQLKQVKKAMLEKMFPRQGATLPEIRFKGFKDNWQISLLSSFLIPSKERNVHMRYSREDVLSVSGDYGIVNQIEFKGRSFAGVSVSNYGVVNVGDIVYTKSPLKSNPYGIIKANKNVPGIVSTLYAIYRVSELASPDFVEAYFALDSRLNSYLRPLVRKGAKNDMKISAEDALLGQVCFPSIGEQRKIAAYFSALDARILCAEKKAQKLKQVKKALLKRMFV